MTEKRYGDYKDKLTEEDIQRAGAYLDDTLPIEKSRKVKMCQVDFLKPCPFCGSDAEIRHGHSHYYARCTNQECLVKTRRYDSIEKAKEAWNRRVNE